MTYCVVYSLYSDGILVMQLVLDKSRFVDRMLKNEVKRRIADGDNPDGFTLTIEQFPESHRRKVFDITSTGEIRYVRTEA